MSAADHARLSHARVIKHSSADILTAEQREYANARSVRALAIFADWAVALMRDPSPWLCVSGAMVRVDEIAAVHRIDSSGDVIIARLVLRSGSHVDVWIASLDE